MNKKLTLNIDDSLIQFAHSYSKKSKQSISTLVEKYLMRLKKDIDRESISSEAKQIYGVLEKKPLPDKKELRKQFYEKSID